MYSIFIANKTKKELRKVPKSTLKRIYMAVESLKIEPRPKEAIKIKGDEGYRIRVGDYRILYIIDEEGKIVYIFRVKPRGRVYK
ncbi:MAG: ParE toxin of type II toxin-antitoxin system, parDE [Candidatus Argoarchaeum ethanivorans]|uniref:ParE toxin of type II toxin-antitoxin system, parDE n=1 Tax=Candidatus Argoarchaeum ethanivorans TaxID=2608793 RepID=A0A811TJA0_9EURY|nr:MAG: ParE toxin of type II toxin-antitoxin system, parDE [Candidatus Argoarchaeum ethanivorans]